MKLETSFTVSTIVSLTKEGFKGEFQSAVRFAEPVKWQVFSCVGYSSTDFLVVKYSKQALPTVTDGWAGARLAAVAGGPLEAVPTPC